MVEMAIFIDGHDLKNISSEEIQKLVNEPPDENGVKVLEILFNENFEISFNAGLFF